MKLAQNLAQTKKVLCVWLKQYEPNAPPKTSAKKRLSKRIKSTYIMI
jgi:hypothetical protein